MTPLPECKWRGQALPNGAYGCSSPMLVVGTGGVSAGFCRTCRYADRDLPQSLPARSRVAATRASQDARKYFEANAAPARPPCRHLGEPTGEKRTCVVCGQGPVEYPVRACSLHGQCTVDRGFEGLACCRLCPDHKRAEASTVYPPVTTRDLAYWVCPVSGNGMWQRNLARLLRHWHLFNGKKVIAVATGTGVPTDEGPRPFDPPDAVRALLYGRDAEVIEVPNDARLREVLGLVPMLERLESRDPNRALFFGHAKGVTRPVNAGVTVHPWADLLYDSLLGYWPAVERVLRSYPVAGTFKKVGHGFEGSASTWHYSGSFFWARSAELFARGWRRVDQVWWGVESYPGIHYRPEEAGVVFHQGEVPSLDLYSMAYLKGTVLPAWERWQAEHAGERTVAP